MLKRLTAFYKLFTQKPSLPATQRGNATVSTILKRRSCRSFTRGDIGDDAFELILEAGRFAPSTANFQTWSFITFNRDGWTEVFKRPIPFNGARAIVVCADTHRNKPLFPEFSRVPLVSATFSIFNAGLAAMNMNLMAECLGVRSIMLSDTGFTGLLDFTYLKQHLGLPEDVIPLTTLVLGLSQSSDPVVAPRLSRQAVVMEKVYRDASREEMEDWVDRMKAGFKLLYPFSDFSSKITYYQGKMVSAERELKESLLKEGDHGGSTG